MIYHGGVSGQLDDLEKEVRKTTKALRPHLAEFDSIAVSGMSGVVVGSPVALRLKKPLVIVRKEDDNCHQGRKFPVNWKNMGYRVLFLDDFVCGGTTRKRVEDKVKEVGGQVVAQYQYQDDIYKERISA